MFEGFLVLERDDQHVCYSHPKAMFVELLEGFGFFKFEGPQVKFATGQETEMYRNELKAGEWDGKSAPFYVLVIILILG